MKQLLNHIRSAWKRRNIRYDLRAEISKLPSYIPQYSNSLVWSSKYKMLVTAAGWREQEERGKQVVNYTNDLATRIKTEI